MPKDEDRSDRARIILHPSTRLRMLEGSRPPPSPPPSSELFQDALEEMLEFVNSSRHVMRYAHAVAEHDLTKHVETGEAMEQLASIQRDVDPEGAREDAARVRDMLVGMAIRDLVECCFLDGYILRYQD